jgi:hypothetical protein
MWLWYGRASGLTALVLPGEATHINQKLSGNLKKKSLRLAQEKYRAGHGTYHHVYGTAAHRGFIS